MTNQLPLTNKELIRIRDTNKSEQTRVLLREISRLHTVVRTLNDLFHQLEIEMANGFIFDSVTWDQVDLVMGTEMRLYGPPQYDRKTAVKDEFARQARESIEATLDNRAKQNQTGGASNVRSDKPGV